MTEFVRFPHTPHLAWLGAGQPRHDKVLSAREAQAFLSHDVTVEEKVDGANVGVSVGEDGEFRAQNRGTYLSPKTAQSQFAPLFRWLEPRSEALRDALFPNLVLFGEWCYAVHSVCYTRLPDWFLAFDVYDRVTQVFWSAERRDGLVKRLGLASVPRIASGHFDLQSLRSLLGESRLADIPSEGIYIRREQGGKLLARAKLVQPEFTQAMGEHWSRLALRKNSLAQGVTWR